MMEFNDTAQVALKKRYLRTDTKPDQSRETPEELMDRVANALAKVEGDFGATKKRIKEVAAEFKSMLEELIFLPNSPTLMNAGIPNGQLSACFVLPIEDNMDSIFETLKIAAKVHQSGGGTGYSFSKLRPKGSLVRSTDGIASGPVSFAKVYNAATEEIKQGGKRRGANLGTLRIDHPDIEQFITCKDNGGFENFNFSVSMTHKFFRRLEEEEKYPGQVLFKHENSTDPVYLTQQQIDAATGSVIRHTGDFELINPQDGTLAKVVKASHLMNLIAEHAWLTGDPGILFIDTINESNATPVLGDIESTNPCGEVPLHAYGSCNLGSINLSKMVNVSGEIDWTKLKSTVHKSVRFLDNVIEANAFPLPVIEKTAKSTRNIGLGVMGYADLLVKLKIPYGSQEAVALADEIMSFVHEAAIEASRALAQERGSFPLFNESVWANKVSELRNATTTCIAPTGSLSILADCSSGIEPIFSFIFQREILDGHKFFEINPLFANVLANKGIQLTEDRIKEVSKLPSIQNVAWIPKELKRYLVTAFDVTAERHLATQAAFQKWTDLAVSKTVNMNTNATVDDVKEVYKKAYEWRCKGVTVFRYGCKKGVLSLKEDDKPASEKSPLVICEKPKKKPRPESVSGDTPRVKTGCGHLYVVVNKDPITGDLCEVIALAGKAGGCTSCLMEALTRIVTLAIRFYTPVEEVSRQLLGLRCPSPTASWESGNGDNGTLSCPDAIGKVLLKHAENAATVAQEAAATALTFSCPDCGYRLDPDGSCYICRSCGFSKCM